MRRKQSSKLFALYAYVSWRRLEEEQVQVFVTTDCSSRAQSWLVSQWWWIDDDHHANASSTRTEMVVDAWMDRTPLTHREMRIYMEITRTWRRPSALLISCLQQLSEQVVGRLVICSYIWFASRDEHVNPISHYCIGVFVLHEKLLEFVVMVPLIDLVKTLSVWPGHRIHRVSFLVN